MNEIDIHIKDVSKDYGSLTALRNVSFDVPARGFVCIVGPSGCGKSTLLRIVLGLEKPTKGEVLLSPERRASGIAYIPQQSLLLPWRTALQNVALGLEVQKPPSPNSLEYLFGLFDRYGLRGFEDAYPDQLSGGMQQRVAIMRAFARRPQILVCDEPFAAVDFVTRLDLNTRFKLMCKVEGITVLFVTHNVEEALFLGDKILVLSGRPGALISSYAPRFTVGAEDAVKCRQDPEFPKLFDAIWNDLKEAHARQAAWEWSTS